jgi:hypothetical protein
MFGTQNMATHLLPQQAIYFLTIFILVALTRAIMPITPAAAGVTTVVILDTTA